MTSVESATWLITGAGGSVGSNLVRHLCASETGPRLVLPVRARRPLVPEHAMSRVSIVDASGDSDVAVELVRSEAPAVVLHLAAATSIAEAQRDPGAAAVTNVAWTARLAAAAEAVGALFLYASTDMVFSGDRPDDADPASFFAEDSAAQPLSYYGRTKLEGEVRTLQNAPTRGFVVRLPLMFGVAHRAVASLSELEPLRQLEQMDLCVAGAEGATPIKAFEDEWRTPLSYDAAAQALIVLAASLARTDPGAAAGANGASASVLSRSRVFHVASSHRASRCELLRALYTASVAIAHALGGDATRPVDAQAVVVGSSQAEYNATAAEKRPRDLSMRADAFRTVCGPVASQLLDQPHEAQWAGALLQAHQLAADPADATPTA